jgi:hypothetical protein
MPDLLTSTTNANEVCAGSGRRIPDADPNALQCSATLWTLRPKKILYLYLANDSRAI